MCFPYIVREALDPFKVFWVALKGVFSPVDTLRSDIDIQQKKKYHNT